MIINQQILNEGLTVLRAHAQAIAERLENKTEEPFQGVLDLPEGLFFGDKPAHTTPSLRFLTTHDQRPGVQLVFGVRGPADAFTNKRLLDEWVRPVCEALQLPYVLLFGAKHQHLESRVALKPTGKDQFLHIEFERRKSHLDNYDQLQQLISSE